jgi:hypothetical protein
MHYTAILFLVLSLFSISQGQKLREVNGRILKSAQLPSVELEFGKGFKYVGGHRFVLYEVANAEQHFFVDADSEGRVRRLYWVQFEGYLPSNKHVYDYTVTNSVNIGGFDFVADAWARNIKASPGRPDGDGARARAFLESKGYKLASDDVISQRLVHLIGDPKRDELMIIYLEDMSPLGLTSADVNKGGKAEGKWNEVSAALLDRAQKDLKIRTIRSRNEVLK